MLEVPVDESFERLSPGALRRFVKLSEGSGYSL